jgi:hypothetical protein
MPFNPGNQNNSGEIWMQAGQNIAATIKQYQQNKLVANQAIGTFEGIANSNQDMLQFLESDNAPDAVKSAYASLKKGGAVPMEKAALLSEFASTYVQQKQQAQMRQMQQMKLAEAQKQEQQGKMLDTLAAFQNGQGTGVYSPQTKQQMQAMLQNPIIAQAVALRSSTGQTPDQSVLGQLGAANIGASSRVAAAEARAQEAENRLASQQGMPQSPLAKLQADRAKAIKEGRTQDSAEIDKQIEMMKFQNVAPEIAGGAKSQMQEANADIAQVVNVGGNLLQNLRPQDVGVAGNVGEWVGDKTLPQLGFNSADPQRIQNRTMLSAYRERALKRVSSDSRFSTADREAIEKMLPSNGVFESLPDAKTRLATVNLVMQQRAGILGNALGEKPLTDYTPEELRLAVKYGIPDQQGRRNPQNRLDFGVAANLLRALYPERFPTQQGKK